MRQFRTNQAAGPGGRRFLVFPRAYPHFLILTQVRETNVEQYRGTTICSVRRGGQVVMGGDGQVTLGNTVMKANARKVRRLYKDRVIAGFAGGTEEGDCCSAARCCWLPVARYRSSKTAKWEKK